MRPERIETERLILCPTLAAEARYVIARQNAADTDGAPLASLRGKTFLGCIGTVGAFGDWLGHRHWEQGYATEAMRASLDWHFAGGGGPLISGHAIGNARSRAALLKPGLSDADVVRRRRKITGVARDQQVMAPSSGSWRAMA